MTPRDRQLETADAITLQLRGCGIDVAVEIFVTILTGFGLAQLLRYGRELGAMEQVIGIMVVIVAIGLLADKIFSPIERFLHRRWGLNP